MKGLLSQVSNLTDLHFLKEILHLGKIDIRKSNIPRKILVSINLQSTKSVTDLRYIFCQAHYIINTMEIALTLFETVSLDQNIYTVINDIKKKRKRVDIDSIHKKIIKNIDF